MRAAAVMTIVLALSFAASAPAQQTGPAPARGAADTTRVSYVAGSSIYLEAGRERGLAEGDTVSVGGAGGIRLRVTAVSSRRAVCEALPTAASSATPRVGDLVYFRRGPSDSGAAAGSSSGPSGAAVTPAPVADSSATEAPALRSMGGRRAIRGRAGVGYLRVEGAGTDYSRPTADLRIEGRTAWGAPIDFVADVRGHRLERAGTTESAARVYRLSATMAADDGGRRFTAGRQSLPLATAPGQFDGASFEMTGRTWSAGLFSGFEPLRYGYDFDPGILWTGVYTGAHGRSGTTRQWGFTLGGMDAHDHGVPSRAALFAQGTYRDSRLSLLAAQAADLNSAWKQARGEPSISSTSTLVTANARITRALTLIGGYDGRRNVLLARDRETPETAFDDRFREGGWAGLSIEPGWSSRLDGTARWTSGGAAGTAWAWSGALERRSIPPFDGRLSLRSSRVESDLETGWLHAATISVRAGGSSEIAFTAGTQSMRDPFLETVRHSTWQGVDADFGFGARWYALLQGQRESGDEGKGTTGYAGLSWRF